MLISLLISMAAAQEPAAEGPTFEPEAQVRPRFEGHSGRDSAAGGGAWFVNTRSRLGVTAKLDDFSARVVFQDVRVWGEEANTLGDFTADGFDLHFGYAQWSPNDKWGVRAGRQEFILHEHRLIGNVGWLQQARAFDGVRAWGGGDGWSGEVAAAMTGNVITPAHESNAGMAYARIGLEGDVKADAVYIVDHVGSRDRTLHTAGVYSTLKTGALSARAEGYAQFGQTDGQDVLAAFVGAQATLAPDASWKPAITLWYDYMTGTADGASGKGQFDTLYATNHKFYGRTDIAWFRQGGPADNRGLQDAAIKFKINPSEQTMFKLDLHAFLPANANGGPGYIGFEPDLYMTHKFAKPVSFSTGIGVFVPESGQTDVWGFGMFDVRL